MAGLGIYLVGAGLLVVAGALKLVRPADTARALAASLPAIPPGVWRPLVRGLAFTEAAVGAVALAAPGRVVAAAMAASYLGFAVWVLWARARGGSLSTCGCFGTPDTPPTITHAAVNIVVAAGAVAVAVASPTGSITDLLGGQYLDGVPLAAASILAAWSAYLVMGPLARLGAQRAMQPWVPVGRA